MFIHHTQSARYHHTIAATGLIVVIMVLKLLQPAACSADADHLPPEIRAKLLLTALAYNKSLPATTPAGIVIGAVAFYGDRRSKEKAAQSITALGTFKDKKINGLSFKAVLMEYTENTAFERAVQEQSVDVLIITAGPPDGMLEISRTAKAEKVLTIAYDNEHLTEYRLSMCIGLKNKRPKIFLNLSSAKAEHADFNAKFLRVVELVE